MHSPDSSSEWSSSDHEWNRDALIVSRNLDDREPGKAWSWPLACNSEYQIYGHPEAKDFECIC